MNAIQLNLLITLKNTACSGKEFLILKYNKEYLALLSFLYSQGVIQSFFVYEDKIEVRFRFYNGVTKLKQIKLISRNSFFKCLNYKILSKIPSTKYLFVFSTDKGFLSLSNCKFGGLGGKLLFIC